MRALHTGVGLRLPARVADWVDWWQTKSPQALSIRWRLTVWYTTILAVMLGAFSLMVYWYMGTSLSRDMHRTSVERGERVDDIIRRFVSGPVSIELMRYDPARGRFYFGTRDAPESLSDVVDPFEDPGVSVRVFDHRGRLRAGSAEADGDEPRVLINRAAVLAGLSGHASAEILTSAGSSFYVYTRPTLYGRGFPPGGVIQIITDRDYYARTMERLASLLLAGTLLAATMAVGLGAALAQTALAPINAITRTANQINRAPDLSRRVPQAGARDEIGRLTETVNEMLDRIDTIFTRQRQFLADVSHELRTPLTTIRGELELMSKTGALDPEGLEAMTSEATRMSRLVDDLLLLARVDSGLTLQMGRVALDGLFYEAGRQARTLAGDTHTVITNGIAPAIVKGDRDRLKQLLLILVDNAVRHTPPGSQITLGLGVKRGATGDEALLSVSDDGPGISPEDQGRIFDRFYRVDKARSRASGGTGLGLSIARWIATAHGGRIEVDSAPNQGTRFTVTLPMDGTAT